MDELAIVTSCDERYAPLAKGLILSLRAHGFPLEHQQLCLLDIGCAKQTLGWMNEHGVHVVRFDASRHIPFPTQHLPTHVAAMAFRPFMRDVFPGFRVYLWIDSDTWVQQADSIHLYHQLAASGLYPIVISPLIDVNYRLQFDARQFRAHLEPIYQAIYGQQGLEMTWRPILGAGVFAMHRHSRIWQAWGAELPFVYQRDYRSVPDGLHLAEQTALNRVVYQNGEAAFLEATHNYHLCAGSALWLDGELCAKSPAWIDGRIACRKIGIAHLCSMGTYAKKYVEARAFFDRGVYLSEAELRGIESLRKLP